MKGLVSGVSKQKKLSVGRFRLSVGKISMVKAPEEEEKRTFLLHRKKA
jgi:hypothetical protein